MTASKTRMNWLNFCALIFAIITIVAEAYQLYDLAHLAKPLTTLLILFMAVKVRSKYRDRFSALLLPALIFCLAGDIFLMYEHYFLPGLGAFLVGQLLLTAAFISKRGFRMHWPSLLFLALYMGGMLTLIAPGLGEMQIPVMAYMFCIVMMSWQALGLYFVQPGRPHALIATGALLFVISDSLIALDKFYMALPMRSLLVLGTYWMALGLIVNGSYLNALKSFTKRKNLSLQNA